MPRTDPPLRDDRPALALTLDLDGAAVRTWVHPAVGTPAGVLLCAHGFRGDHHGLRRLVNALPQYLVIVPDLPGFGASTPVAGGSHDAEYYAALLASLAGQLELPDDTILLGHSFGSVVAARLAAAAPDRFSALALVNPISRPALEMNSPLASAVAGAYYRVAARLPRAAGEALLRARVVVDVTTLAMLTSRDPAVRRWVRDQHRSYFSAFSDPATLLQAYASSVRDSVRDVAAELSVPTLLVAGERDPLGSVEAQRTLRDLIPRAELVVIPQVGHLIHYETPASAAGAIEDFLLRLRSAPAAS